MYKIIYTFANMVRNIITYVSIYVGTIIVKKLIR